MCDFFATVHVAPCLIMLIVALGVPASSDRSSRLSSEEVALVQVDTATGRALKNFTDTVEDILRIVCGNWESFGSYSSRRRTMRGKTAYTSLAVTPLCILAPRVITGVACAYTEPIQGLVCALRHPPNNLT